MYHFVESLLAHESPTRPYRVRDNNIAAADSSSTASSSSSSSSCGVKPIPLILTIDACYKDALCNTRNDEIISNIREMVTNSSIDQFRSSDKLHRLLCAIIKKSNTSIDYTRCNKNIYLCKHTNNSIINILITVLCMPLMTTLVGLGRYLMVTDNSHTSSGSSSGSSTIVESETLLSKLHYLLYEGLVLLQRYIQVEDDEVLDKTRIRFIIECIIFRFSVLLPFVLTVTEYLPILLDCMTLHILGTRALASDIKATINQVVIDIRDRLSVNIMNSPIQDIQHIIEESVTAYFAWLRTNKFAICRVCMNAEVVSCIDSNVRAWLKEEVYESPVEIVSAYHQKYRAALTNIPVPILLYCPEDIHQAVKDIARETILINRTVCTGIDEVLRQIKSLFEEYVLPNLTDVACDVSVLSAIITKDASTASMGDANADTKLVVMLYQYLLIAMSRTAAGGDAFIMLSDLFGGDGLVICPFTATASAANARSSSSSSHTVVTISASEISITVKERYCLFSNESNIEQSKALMSFSCHTNTITSLSSVKSKLACSSSSSSSTSSSSYHDKLTLNPERVTKRYISIEPVAL